MLSFALVFIDRIYQTFVTRDRVRGGDELCIAKRINPGIS